MRVPSRLMLLFIAMAVGTTAAQQPTPTPLMDGRGLPLPFGVQPYYKPDVPLGSGPHKAIMAAEAGLSAHVAYFPANLAALGARKMPILIWGNGSCLYAGNRYRQFLTDVASYGYLVIAGGPMGAVELEVGPQSNPAPRRGGAGRAGADGARPGSGDWSSSRSGTSGRHGQRRPGVARHRRAIEGSRGLGSQTERRCGESLQ